MQWTRGRVSNHSNSLPFSSSRPGRPPKRAPVGLSLAASHLQHQQIKKHRMDNGDYPYENGHMGGEFFQTTPFGRLNSRKASDDIVYGC